ITNVPVHGRGSLAGFFQPLCMTKDYDGDWQRLAEDEGRITCPACLEQVALRREGRRTLLEAEAEKIKEQLSVYVSGRRVEYLDLGKPETITAGQSMRAGQQYVVRDSIAWPA